MHGKSMPAIQGTEIGIPAQLGDSEQFPLILCGNSRSP